MDYKNGWKWLMERYRWRSTTAQAIEYWDYCGLLTAYTALL